MGRLDKSPHTNQLGSRSNPILPIFVPATSVTIASEWIEAQSIMNAKFVVLLTCRRASRSSLMVTEPSSSCIQLPTP